MNLGGGEHKLSDHSTDLLFMCNSYYVISTVPTTPRGQTSLSILVTADSSTLNMGLAYIGAQATCGMKGEFIASQRQTDWGGHR